jgi:selenocysteine lyase/cysteine desulfurase
MFGFPTGVAALIIRNAAAEELWGIGGGPRALADSSSGVAAPPVRPTLSSLRSYFSGGTLNAAIADEDFHVLKSNGRLSDLLEDGTVAFTSIVSVPYGLQLFASLGHAQIHAHTTTLIDSLYAWLSAERYADTNTPLCIFYGERSSAPSSVAFGPTLNFNFLESTGRVIGYKTVDKMAIANKIFIRVRKCKRGSLLRCSLTSE